MTTRKPTPSPLARHLLEGEDPPYRRYLHPEDAGEVDLIVRYLRNMGAGVYFQPEEYQAGMREVVFVAEVSQPLDLSSDEYFRNIDKYGVTNMRRRFRKFMDNTAFGKHDEHAIGYECYFQNFPAAASLDGEGREVKNVRFLFLWRN